MPEKIGVALEAPEKRDKGNVQDITNLSEIKKNNITAK